MSCKLVRLVRNTRRAADQYSEIVRFICTFDNLDHLFDIYRRLVEIARDRYRHQCRPSIGRDQILRGFGSQNTQHVVVDRALSNDLVAEPGDLLKNRIHLRRKRRIIDGQRLRLNDDDFRYRFRSAAQPFQSSSRFCRLEAATELQFRSRGRCEKLSDNC